MERVIFYQHKTDLIREKYSRLSNLKGYDRNDSFLFEPKGIPLGLYCFHFEGNQKWSRHERGTNAGRWDLLQREQDFYLKEYTIYSLEVYFTWN